MLRLKGTFTLMHIIMITMRDWNVSVRTCRIIGYQQTVNSTFIEMSYLGGDAYMSKEVKDVRQKENDQCKTI